MPEVIRTERLARAFNRQPAVRSLDLAVPKGSVYAFLGPNGAGKSTTIRLLLGLLKPDSGSIHIFGLPLATERLAVLHRVGSLVETPSVYPHLTATENLAIPARLLNRSRSDIDRALAVAGLSNVGRKLVRAFSLGMKQRLGLALALLAQPELLILDEPTNGLDPAGIHEVRQLLRAMPSEHGVTVFLSSHLLGEVEQLATHVGMLSQGDMVFQGTVEMLSERRRSRLRIVVDRPAEAAVLLAARGWDVERHDEAVIAATSAPAATINRTLVEAGFDVHQLAHESDSLEHIFLGMTHSEAR
jgi:ABC-type multidrug transport system ATPase subunit